jgi:FAD binding domain
MNMHADENSDGVIVPEKRSNNEGVPLRRPWREGPRPRGTAVRRPRPGRCAGIPRRTDSSPCAERRDRASSSAARSASHSRAAAPWHFGQCLLRQLMGVGYVDRIGDDHHLTDMGRHALAQPGFYPGEEPPGTEIVEAFRHPGLVTAGAGVSLRDVYQELANVGYAVPAGSCPTVGIAGHSFGGGYGLLTKSHGLTCDNLQQVTLIDAQASTLKATATSEPDLFWACRGGGGGSFCIATQFVLRIFPLSDVLVFGVSWPALGKAGLQMPPAPSPRS